MSGRLFYEDEREAVRAMIAAANSTIQKCASHMWPHMKPQSAYSKLYAQLNGNDESEQLKFAEVLELARWLGQFDALYYVCDELNHGRPALKAPSDEQAELVNTIKGAASVMDGAMKRLEALQARFDGTRR